MTTPNPASAKPQPSFCWDEPDEFGVLDLFDDEDLAVDPLELLLAAKNLDLPSRALGNW